MRGWCCVPCCLAGYCYSVSWKRLCCYPLLQRKQHQPACCHYPGAAAVAAAVQLLGCAHFAVVAVWGALAAWIICRAVAAVAGRGQTPLGACVK